MQVFIAPQAEVDLEEIGDYIAADNLSRALTFVHELRMQCERIAAAPLAYPARPELGDDIRLCPHGRYLIIFNIQPSG